MPSSKNCRLIVLKKKITFCLALESHCMFVYRCESVRKCLCDPFFFRQRFIHNITETLQRFSLRLQKGCRPDQVPLGKQILSAEPYSVCPTVQVKRTLLRTLKFPVSLVAWAGMPGSPQVPAVSPATGDNQTRSAELKRVKIQSILPARVCLQMGPFKPLCR